MTRYVVFGEQGGEPARYVIVGEHEAPNAESACRKVADGMHDSELENGVTLFAVPARNWNGGRNRFTAEIRRRLLKS